MVASITAITGVIFVLRDHVPVVSTGVLYLLAVLLVSSYWGLLAGPADLGPQRCGLQLLPHPPHRAGSRSPRVRTGWRSASTW